MGSSGSTVARLAREFYWHVHVTVYKKTEFSSENVNESCSLYFCALVASLSLSSLLTPDRGVYSSYSAHKEGRRREEDVRSPWLTLH